MMPYPRISLRLALCSGIVLLLLSACASSRESSDAAATATKEDERVNIGYGTQDRDEVTGAVSSVSEEDLDRYPSVSLQQLLATRVPGVYVMEAPGGGIKVTIRGQNTIMGNSDPLFVVDGMPVSGTSDGVLSSINPRDIKKIEVLKDGSSTAIYGSRGANGVVIITTKRGGD